MCCKRYHIIFSTFPLNLKCKICVQKDVMPDFKKSHFGHVTSYELTHFKKMVRVWKTKSLWFCSRYDPLIVLRRQNHITFIFMKTMSHDLLVQIADLGQHCRQVLNCEMIKHWHTVYNRAKANRNWNSVKTQSLGKSLRDLTDSQIRGEPHFICVTTYNNNSAFKGREWGRKKNTIFMSKLFSKQGS